MLRHLGGVGVFILAALDSSVLPTLGAVDALTIVLAARHPELWPLLRHVQHGRLGLRGFSRLPPVGLGVLHRRIKGPCSVARRTASPTHSRLPHSCFLLVRRAIASLRLCCPSAQDGRADLLYWLISRLCLAGDPWRGRGRPTRCYF